MSELASIARSLREIDTPSERLDRVLARVRAHRAFLALEAAAGRVTSDELARAEQLLRNVLFEAGEDDWQ